MDKKYLDEEKYKKAEKALTASAIIVLLAGLCIGGFLIFQGITKPSTSKADELKTSLETKRKDLEAKGVTYSDFSQYTDGEAYDLKIVTKALDPSFDYCEFDEYKNNSLTKEYCSAKNGSSDMASTAMIGAGGFVCFLSVVFFAVLLATAKQRHILAFKAQQAMPIVKEGVSEVAPEIAKGIKKGLKDDE